MVTTLPTWAVYTLSFGSPLLAFVGVLAGWLVTRRGATELEARSKREELMRMLRWASELAISEEDPRARLGVAELGVLLNSSLLTEQDVTFVRAALTANLRNPVERMAQLGADAQATLVPAPALPEDPALPAEPAVPSDPQPEREEED